VTAPQTPAPKPEGLPRPPVIEVDISDIPVTRLDVDPAELRDGKPSAVPWVEFEGNPENGRARFLHVGARTMQMSTDGYVREIAVWPNGVVWFQDLGLRFGGWDGHVVKVEGFPAWYGRVLFAPTKAYAIRRGVVISVAAGDLTPKLERPVADLVGVERDDPSLRSSLSGLLAFDDPVLRASYMRDGKRTWAFYSVQRGLLPLSPKGYYLHSPASGLTIALFQGRAWAGYDSDGFRPLWSHSFVDGRRHLDGSPTVLSPSGRRILVSIGNSGRDFLIVDARTGKVARRVHAPTFSVQFEDDTHLLFPVYDGPPNPAFDASDTEPAPDELEWPNVLVRCSLAGFCERAAYVEAPQRSIHLGFAHLFPR